MNPRASSRPVAATSRTRKRDVRFAFIAPRHRDGSEWPWLSQVGAMQSLGLRPIFIENTFRPFPKATRAYVRWQYLRAMRKTSRADLVFLFSTSIVCGMTTWPSRLLSGPRRVYVGFTQDGDWSPRKMQRLAWSLQQCDAVTVFSEDERRLYVERFGLDPQRVHVIPIHTDEVNGYERYPDQRPEDFPQGDYVLSLGSPNRRFMPIARACCDLKIPLVIITRPTHSNDSLHELAELGATIITDADKMRSLTYLKHARLAAMSFKDPHLPGAFTTLIHGMFLRTPCVVSSCLGIGDYVVDGETGIVTPHGDDDALQLAIERLWHSQELIDRFAQRGAERAQRLFSIEAAADRFSDLATRVLATT